MKELFYKVIIWDFDNTLYKPNPDLSRDVRDAEIRVIMDHTGWDQEEATKQFYSLYGRIYTSATETSANLAGLSFVDAAREMEHHFDRMKYLGQDKKLVDLFSHLGEFRHFILTNGVVEKVSKTLEGLGLSPAFFEQIVNVETTGYHKPQPEIFAYVLNKTKLAPPLHLMVGDRKDADIEPAKSAGMHTVQVWGECEAADYCIPDVYSIEKILLKS